MTLDALCSKYCLVKTLLRYPRGVLSSENSASLPQRCPVIQIGTGFTLAFRQRLVLYSSTYMLDGFDTHFDGSPLFCVAHALLENRLARPGNCLDAQPQLHQMRWSLISSLIVNRRFIASASYRLRVRLCRPTQHGGVSGIVLLSN